MRMRWDEKCIIPDCDRAGVVGAKPIYIRLTVDGKRTLKKVGALCEEHLPPELLIEDYVLEKDIRSLEKGLLQKDAERILKPGDVLEPGEKVTIPHDFPGQGIVDQVLPRKNLKDAKLSVADWREISELGKRILPGTEKVHCDDCGCDNVPDKDGDGNVFCAACGALIEAGGIDWSASIEKGEEP